MNGRPIEVPSRPLVFQFQLRLIDEAAHEAEVNHHIDPTRQGRPRTKFANVPSGSAGARRRSWVKPTAKERSTSL